MAKAIDRAGASSADAVNSPTITAHATQAGLILGTAAYMAPEQARGRPVDRRADIWAFGVVLYEMLTGARAFTGDDVSETLAAVLKSTPAFDALPATTPPRLRRLIERCLVRDPRERLRDMGDARLELDQILKDDDAESSRSLAAGPTAPAPSRRWLRALPWTIAILTTAGAMILAWALVHPSIARPRTVTRATISVQKSSAFPALSRDGSRLAYCSLDSTFRSELRLRTIDQIDDRPIPGAGGALFPVFSPDGSWIAFNDEESGSIKKIPVTGGPATTLTTGHFIFQDGADWGDDNTIVFSGASGLMRLPANGGTPQPLTMVDATKGETAHVRPQFLPDGRQLLFTIVSAGRNATKEFAVLDLHTGRYRPVAPGGDNGHYAPNGFLTFLRQSTVFAVPFDLARLVATGPETPVIESVSVISNRGADYTFSNTGVLVYFQSTGDTGTTLGWSDRKGTTTALPGAAAKDWGVARLSPDGTRVAADLSDDKGGSDIWVLDIGRSTTTRLTTSGESGGVNTHAIWSPDGHQIVYGSSGDGQSGVWSVAADGGGKPIRLIATDRLPVPSSFAPDGAAFVYDEPAKDRRRHVVVVSHPFDAATRSSRVFREDRATDDRDAQISPDGRWIAYTSQESGGDEVYVEPFPGAGARIHVSPHGGHVPRWSPGGLALLYWIDNDRTLTSAAVAVTPAGLAVGAAQALFPLTAVGLADVAADNRFLVEIGKPGGPIGSPTCIIVTNWFDELERRARPKTE